MTTARIKVEHRGCRWALANLDVLLFLPLFAFLFLGVNEFNRLKDNYASLQEHNLKLQQSVQSALDEADRRMNVILRLDKSSAELAETVKSQNAALQALNAQFKSQAKSCELQIEQEQTIRKKQHEQIAKIQKSLAQSKCAVPKSLFNGLRSK